jgi:hypothetical protein
MDGRNWNSTSALIWLLLACGVLATSSAFGSGQQGPRSGEDGYPAPPVTPPSFEAFRVEEGPVLDGQVLEDPVWQSAVPTRQLWQNRPDEGMPASEETEVRVVFTNDTLYFGVVCFDGDSSSIIISDSRRDASLEESDSFQIILDTYRDLQNGFVFGTNPAAIEYDGQVANEGQGGGFGAGRQRGGSNAGFNLNWDGSWEVRTLVGETGWSIEFAIPFKTLRFPGDSQQIWGVNFQRNIRRRNEASFWAPLPRQFSLYRLSMAGTLTGIEVPGQRNLKVIPYVLGEARKQPTRDTLYTGDWGVDVKYSLTPSLTLDATYNTDFAQVEVDDFQINLDRFNLFFPEKRPFFLENAGLFAVGSPGEADLFFSRRIGIGPEGEIIPIIAGGRVSGKVARTNVGFLNMQTEQFAGDESLVASNNFTVARVSRELPNRSSLGAIFVNRQGSGDYAVSNDYNRTYGVDGRWGIGEYGQINGFLAGTSSPDRDGGEYAFKIDSSYDAEHWMFNGGLTTLGENFNPEVGFLSREGGYRKPSGMAMYRLRPVDTWGLYEVRPHVSYRGFWKLDGFQESGYLHVDNHLEWRNGYEFHTGINFTREGVLESFEIYPDIDVLPGTYDHKEAQLVFNTNRGAPVSLQMRATLGGFFGGDRVSLAPTLRMRAGENLTTEFTWSRNDIDIPTGAFVTNLGRARISYSFTPRIFVQALVQYNDRADLWSTNLRFGWLQAANTGLFVVYNDSRGLAEYDRTLLPDRSLTIKFNRMFDVLR